jgi:hypothetical protein
MMMGPWATQLLGDLGADIIKIERPGSGEWERGLEMMGQLLAGDSPCFLAMNRNKRSLALNLKHPEARRIIDALVPEVDVVVENNRRARPPWLWLRAALAAQPTPDLLLGQRLRLARAVRRSARPGPAHPGLKRPHRA